MAASLSLNKSGASKNTNSVPRGSSGTKRKKIVRKPDPELLRLSREKKLQQRHKQKTYHRSNDIPNSAEMEADVELRHPSESNTDLSQYLETLLNSDEQVKTPDEFSCKVRVTPYDCASFESVSAQQTSLAPISGIYQDEYYDHQHQPIEQRPSFLKNPHVLMLTRSIGYYCGEKAKRIAEFFAARPALLMVVLMIVASYFLLSLMEMSLVILLDPMVRFFWVHVHWLLVVFGQGFRSTSNWFYTADQITEAWFCDFAEAWCARFNALCDRRCSHVDRALERLRPHEQ